MTQETEDVVGRMIDARDTLAGHLFGNEANAVSAGIDLIQSLSERIAERDYEIGNLKIRCRHLLACLDRPNELDREDVILINATRASLTQGGNAVAR